MIYQDIYLYLYLYMSLFSLFLEQGTIYYLIVYFGGAPDGT